MYAVYKVNIDSVFNVRKTYAYYDEQNTFYILNGVCMVLCKNRLQLILLLLFLICVSVKCL